jgi:phosphatidylglycerol---prolipoprotein diacylglyceryl transferase
MLNFPAIDPVALALGPVKIHWYGLMYLVGFAAAWWLGRRRARAPNSGWSDRQVEDLIFFGAIGVIVGGRLGYILFYNFSGLIADPLMVLRIWQGGMSFHGGLIGVLLALGWLARRQQRSWWQTIDFVAPLVPIGLAAGRLGNFINGELWGRVSDLPWAVLFPHAGDLPRHPSQLYQFALEGVVLFIVLWLYSAKPRPVGAVSGLFAIGYAVSRFTVEFVREPDAHLGLLTFGLTMGQWLTLPLFFVGCWLMWRACRPGVERG